jgi:membrane-bound serine protease (ClpP class)
MSSGSKFRRVVIASVALLLICAAGTADKSSPTTAPTTEPATVRVEKDRIYVGDDWFARPKVKRSALPKEITTAFVIPIHGPITKTTYQSVRRKVIKCKSSGAQMVIFDMDTPGGQMSAMSGIVRQIIDDLRDVYTVAYVHPQAFSAGAIISLACDEIVMSPTAVIGDAMPIMIIGGKLVEIPEKERGKFESAARAEVRMLAERNGHNQALCEAMITITMKVWLIRNTKTGELQIVNPAKEHRKIRGDPTATTRPSEGETKLADGQWKYLKTIDGTDELVTLTTMEAQRLGFIVNTFDDMDDLEKHYNITVEPVVLGDNWSEDLVALLTSPVVMSILMFVGILAVYAELHTPGFGAAGAVAIVCFAIVFGSHYLVGLANWWEIALFFVGVALLAVELLLIPGFGVAGVAGLFCCVVALLAMLIPNAPTELPWPETEGAWDMFKTGAIWMMVAFVAATVASMFLARYLPKVPIAGRLVLVAPEAPHTPPTTADAPILNVVAGQVGKVTQTCRPVGKVRIDGRLVDAIADGAFIEAGAEIIVLRNEGNRVVIETKA